MKIQEKDRKHICDEDKLVFIKQEGDLVTYKCPECNKEVHSLVCISVDKIMEWKKEYYSERN